MNLQFVHMKGQDGEQGAAKSPGLCRDHISVNMEEMQTAENRKQEKQQWCDTGKAKKIETAQRNLRQRTPTPDRDGSDQESGDDKKHLHAQLRVPNENVNELRRNKPGVGYVRPEQSDINVIHQNEKNRKPAEQVDAIETLPGAGRRLGVGRSHVSLLHQKP